MPLEVLAVREPALLHLEAYRVQERGLSSCFPRGCMIDGAVAPWLRGVPILREGKLTQKGNRVVTKAKASSRRSVKDWTGLVDQAVVSKKEVKLLGSKVRQA